MSGHNYSRSVLLQMAAVVEDSSGRFYNTLSKKFPENQSVFQRLAEDEDVHAKLYRRLLSKDGAYVAKKEELKRAEYNIRILEGSGLVGNLRSGEERAKKSLDLTEALNTAVQLEKDTMLFYYDLSMAVGSDDRQEIYKIIRVEHSHLYKIQHLSS